MLLVQTKKCVRKLKRAADERVFEVRAGWKAVKLLHTSDEWAAMLNDLAAETVSEFLMKAF